MSEISKDKTNRISCLISIIGLVLIFIGVIQIILPLLLVGGLFGGFEGLMVAILLPVASILCQGVVINVMYKGIKNKGFTNKKTGQDVPIRKAAMYTSIINLVIILIIIAMSGVFIYAPIFGILLLLAPIITIVAGFIFKEYS